MRKLKRLIIAPRSLALASCLAIALILTTTSCSINTNSTIILKFANNGKPTGDPTALHTVGFRNMDAAGCLADGGMQPPSGIPFGWISIGTSPAAGQCHFPDKDPNGNYMVDYFSGACAARGLPHEFTGFLQFTNGTSPSENLCTINSSTLAAGLDSHFSIMNQSPATITLYTSGLTAANGFPQLLVYDITGVIVGQSTAIAVAPDGSSATFPFPSTTGGGTLFAGFYMLAVRNMTDSSGGFVIADANYYSLGQGIPSAGAFGVDAVDITETSTVCVPGVKLRCSSQSTATWTFAAPILTQYYANQVTFRNVSIAVGVQPVAVKAYGSTNVLSRPNNETTIKDTIPARAVVVNLGSNNVSILDLATSSIVATIAVGVQPVGLVLNSTATKAYVANYGSGTVSEIDLTALAVTRTATVGAGAQTVAMDPSGASIWVGGNGYLEQVDLTSFAVSNTQMLNGAVTSLAVSNQQNELVYTLVGSCCSDSSTYGASELSLSNLSTPGTYGTNSASALASFDMNATLPSPSLNPGATQVSTQWANGMAASATPTGFVIYDVINHTEVIRGTTPTPVRGIASDPNNTTIYMTVPDSNQYLIVKLPPLS